MPKETLKEKQFGKIELNVLTRISVQLRRQPSVRMIHSLGAAHREEQTISQITETVLTLKMW